jgi:hypothetical protein
LRGKTSSRLQPGDQLINNHVMLNRLLKPAPGFSLVK